MKSKILYHYTSLETLVKILDVKEEQITLRATDIRFLNDPSEYLFGRNFIYDSLKKYERKNKINRNDSIRNNIKKIEEFGDKNGYTPFVISFSEDDNNLPMWRTYGKDGLGIAIGFDFNSIENPINISKEHYILKCEYDDKKILKKLDDFWSNNYNTIRTESAPVFFSLAQIIKHLNISIKCPEYIYEKEWRLYCIDQERKSKYKTTGKSIIPFIEFTLPKSSLKEISIGPCLEQSIIEAGINQLLYDRKYDSNIKIKKSKLSYRIL